MKCKREFCPFLFVALSVLCFVFPARSMSAPDRLVWFSDHKAIKAIDTQTNTIVRAVDLIYEPEAFAVDPTGNVVWTLRGRRLTKLSDTGVELLRIDLDALDRHFGTGRLLKLDPYRGSLWVASKRKLLQISSSGERLARWTAPRGIDALAIDTDESLWVIGDRKLFHLSADASPLDSVDLHRHFDRADQLVVDGLGGVIWVADERRLLRLDLNHVSDKPRLVSLRERDGDKHRHHKSDYFREIRAIEAHPILGTLWVATRNKLLLFDRNGVLVKAVTLPRIVDDVNAIAFDPPTASLWIAGRHGVGRYTVDGDLITVVSADRKAESVGAGGFTLYPTVTIREPLDGSSTNNPRPPVGLSLGSVCSGAPCLLPDAYTQSLNLDVTLNGVPIGSQFGISGSEATYSPAVRLPEGVNTLVAQGRDLFGHRSGEATSRFVIDTIPPKFISVSPADGSTLNNAAIEISGELDDPTANVVLADGNGQGISMTGGKNFSFAIILKTGLNVFTLTARDPAGNESSTVLRLTYIPVSVKITSPSAGATLDSLNTIVTGDFMGPANTGIVVNGTAAEILGSHFYVNLALQPGSNTLTAVATTPAGASVTDAVEITVNTPSTAAAEITVEPQSGIAPLTVRFSAQSGTAQPLTQLSVDTNNDGTPELSTGNPADPVEYVYTTPGLYKTRITATDGAGAVTEQTVAIVVNDAQQMDQRFTQIWGGMNEALVHGDIAAASNYLNDTAKRKYEPVFEALKADFPQIIASYSPLRRVSVSSDIGEYAIVRPNNGQNQLYLIYFLRDVDGVWRVDQM